MGKHRPCTSGMQIERRVEICKWAAYQINGNVVLDGVEEDTRRCRKRAQKETQITQLQWGIGRVTRFHVNGHLTG